MGGGGGRSEKFQKSDKYYLNHGVSLNEIQREWYKLEINDKLGPFKQYVTVMY